MKLDIIFTMEIYTSILKTIEMNEASYYIYDGNIYINFNLGPLTNFRRNSRSIQIKDILPSNILRWSWRPSLAA